MTSGWRRCFTPTGTPIDAVDKNTRAVFGDYISVYDIQRAVEDGATVPISYESRLAKLDLNDDLKKVIDDEFEEVTEQEEESRKERLKSRWAALEAVVGADPRVKRIAEDLVRHFEARLDVIKGKAMVVCMSRRICVDMYAALVALGGARTWSSRRRSPTSWSGPSRVIATAPSRRCR